MKILLCLIGLVSIMSLVNCSSEQGESEAIQQQDDAVAIGAEGFLGFPWGTDTTAIKVRYRLQPFSKIGEVQIMQADLNEYEGTPVRSATFAFRNGRFIGVGFESPNDDATTELLAKFDATFGQHRAESSTYDTSGVPNNSDSVGAYTDYRWESEETTIVLARVHGGESYVFIMKKGESLPQLG